jgi:hypothetical protein
MKVTARLNKINAGRKLYAPVQLRHKKFTGLIIFTTQKNHTSICGEVVQVRKRPERYNEFFYF